MLLTCDIFLYSVFFFIFILVLHFLLEVYIFFAELILVYDIKQWSWQFGQSVTSLCDSFKNINAYSYYLLLF